MGGDGEEGRLLLEKAVQKYLGPKGVQEHPQDVHTHFVIKNLPLKYFKTQIGSQ